MRRRRKTRQPAGATPELDPPPAPRRALASQEETAVRRHLASWTGSLSPADGGTTVVWRDSGQEYTAVLKHVPAADAMGMEQLLVELTTERGGEKLATELRMNRVAFSNFAQFIDHWDPEVQIHDDLIDGRFHSNSEIRVSRERGVKPVFNGKVTLAAGDVRTDGVGFLNRRTMFPAGIETRVRRIVLPPRAETFQHGAVPPDRVHRFSHDSLLTFHEDGTFDSRALDEGGIAAGGPLGDEPFYLLANEGVVAPRARHGERQGARILPAAHRRRRRPALRRGPASAGLRRLPRPRSRANRRDRRARGHGLRRPRAACVDLRAQPFCRARLSPLDAAAR